MKKPQPVGLSDASLLVLWRRAVLKRGGYKCAVCASGGKLECHHVIHRRYKMLRWYAPNGIPVHPWCHAEADFRGLSMLDDDVREDLVTNAQVTFKQFLAKWGMTESEWRAAVKADLLREIAAAGGA